MKILFLCHRFPFPPKRGGKIRPFNIIRHLSARADVYVGSLVRDAREAEEGAGLAQHCTEYFMAPVEPLPQLMRMVLRLPTPVPSSMGYFRAPALASRVRQWMSQHRFDLAFVHCSSAAQYIDRIPGVPRILDFGDMDSQKWFEYAQYKPWPLSWGYGLEGWKLEREEKRLASRFDLCTTTTQGELETLRSFGRARDTDWFPNGVDADFFCPTDESYDPHTISFIGRMDYFPNQECVKRMCEEVFPAIQREIPTARFLVVGADPSPEIRALGSLPGVEVTGSVPDVRPFVRKSAVMVAPLAIARGTQNKILEAMAMGVPVVTSTIAAKGVGPEARRHLVVADSPADTIRAVLGIMNSRSERQERATAGRLGVIESHSWPASMRQLDAIIGRVTTAARQRT